VGSAVSDLRGVIVSAPANNGLKLTSSAMATIAAALAA
jgi:hypothetical protein